MFEDIFSPSKIVNDLYYINKGREQCAPNYGYGPVIRGHFLVHVVLNGKGTFHTKESTYELEIGQFFVIFPDELTYYEADEKTPWEYLWFGFNGEAVNGIFKMMEITPSNPVGTINDFDNEITKIIHIVEKDTEHVKTRLELIGDLYYLLSLLISETTIDGNMNVNKTIDKKTSYTEAAIDIIRENYQRPDFLVREISENLSLNQSYLTTVFKEVTNKTLHGYLISYRILMSRSYLEFTDLSITQISELVGYDNTLSFTRAFKRLMKMTPTMYKSMNSKEHNRVYNKLDHFFEN